MYTHSPHLATGQHPARAARTLLGGQPNAPLAQAGSFGAAPAHLWPHHLLPHALPYLQALRTKYGGYTLGQLAPGLPFWVARAAVLAGLLRVAAVGGPPLLVGPGGRPLRTRGALLWAQCYSCGNATLHAPACACYAAHLQAGGVHASWHGPHTLHAPCATCGPCPCGCGGRATAYAGRPTP